MGTVSATTGGAVKALLESGGGVGAAVFRDKPPPGTALPCIVVLEGIARAEEMSGDFGATSGGVAPEVREELQVEIWQAKVNIKTGAMVENYTLPRTVRLKLHGRILTTSPTRSWPMRVTTSRRVPPTLPKDGSGGSNLVRDILSVIVLREI